MSIALLRCLLLLLAVTAGPAFADDALLWFEAGRPTAQAAQATAVLESAADQGLQPDDYHAAALARLVARARLDPPLAPAAQSALDGALTIALQRYLVDLRDGRVDPRALHADFDVPRRAPLDTLSFVRSALAERRLAQALAQAQPQLPMYAGLRAALARYRGLGNHPAWQSPLPALPGRKVAPGQAYAGTEMLAQRLKALGDLAADAPVTARLDGPLVPALQAFQERHGLAADGVLGQSTLQQLNVAPAARARQIELALERLRWTPFLQAPRMIVVNVPEFVLRAYEVRDGKVDVRLTMKVIVGKALHTRTPLFDETLRFIEFNPYWNVPPSIARHEIVPKLRRDPGYFEREGFEFVTGSGQVSTTLSPDHLEAVLHAGWRIRQRPGSRNALGDIKFVFPNRDNIYLHHTPTVQLFQRDRRDFSHGCIRVESPVALAQFVFGDDPAWTEEAIREAMAQGESHTVRLAQPLPVLIAYSTVLVKGGRVFFFPDLYGHDRLLDAALRQRTATNPPLPLSLAEAQ